MQGSKRHIEIYNEVALKADSILYKIIMFDKYNVLLAAVGLTGKTDKQRLMLISGK